MISEKKPSIYVDRGTIGSSDELDEYGVWVKSEPQDLSSAGIETLETSELSAESISGDDLSSEDFSTDLSFDSSINIPYEEEAEAESADTSGDLDIAIPDMEELPDFDTSEETPMEINNDSFDLAEPEQAEEIVTIEEDNDSDIFNFGDISENTDLAEISEETESFEKEDESEFDGGGSFVEVSLDDFSGDTETSPEETINENFAFETIMEQETKAESAPVESGSDLSTQLLMRIADELSSIRTELGSLKKEFSGLKAAAAQSDADEKGFFGVEDDDKIALTGDELINIMNTADFTEETGTDATAELSEIPESTEEEISFTDTEDKKEIDFMELELEDSSLDELEGETKLDETASIDDSFELDDGEVEISFDDDDDIQLDTGTVEDEVAEEVTLDTLDVDVEDVDGLDFAESEEALPDFEVEETEELRLLREEGAGPMISDLDPEDADYLTEESEPLEESTEGDLEQAVDLSDAVIDEPDFSSEIQDNPLEEPSLEDISINLDLSDLDSEDFSSVESDEAISEGFEEIDQDDLSFSESFADTGSDISSDSEQSGADNSLIPEGFGVEIPDAEDTLALKVTEDAEETIHEVFPSDDFESVDFAADEAPENIPSHLKEELKTVLTYMDQLLESLPDDKIEEFAQSEHYDTYKKLFRELGLV